MTRTTAFIAACLLFASQGAIASNITGAFSEPSGPSPDQCRQAFRQSAAASTCSVPMDIDVSRGMCAIRASCLTGRGSVGKSAVNATYPEGVRQLVNCSGNLRHRRC
ncbi:MAG: hypothetical protein GAK28_02716 [Luteibacter sp.]|uniref:hypothetical protein n=1 Tax=Luteibacter sp. TaxID=1886636 RepID=UPI00137D6629|nr:hypothetical protein [Luteibacter sp.]KAF1006098.1 MAG: hypothetical protein GAK28_02716 [Luteibacter sp.]